MVNELCSPPRGRRVYDLAGARVTTEIHGCKAGLLTFAFLFQHSADDETEAAELFRTFAESFRTLGARKLRPASDAGTGR